MPEFLRNYISEFFSDSLANIDFSSFSVIRVSLLDVIDILIVAYFVYKIILWVKETRAWALFKGIVVILAISCFSFVFKLNTISWIMKTALSVGILAIIILFQPELRKALEQLGKGKFMLPFNIYDDDGSSSLSAKTLDEILKAAFIMAKERTGALILIEDEVALGDLEQTGIYIDAKVSSSLLINIFEDKTPLHDGAVIIRNNRIAAASCILPLTQTEIGKELGTRHRAAVGASEVSDANVIIVSEESGAVSLARGGKIFKNQTMEELRGKLLSEESPIDKKRFILKRGIK